VCDQVGLTLCGTTCFDLKTDEQHCGTCGNACTGNYSCIAGACRCGDPIIGTALRLTTTTADSFGASAAWDGTHVGVVYLEGTDARRSSQEVQGNLYFALLNPDGTRAMASDLTLTSYDFLLGDRVNFPADITWNGAEYGVVWSTYAGQRSDTWFLRIAADGKAKGTPVSITANTATPASTRSPRISWSASYGGYALATYLENYPAAVDFQRIGATGGAPEQYVRTTLSTPSSSFDHIRPAISSAAGGGWMLATTPSVWGYLVAINADGSRTQAAVQIGFNYRSADADVLHDGTTWITGWADHYTNTAVRINRGSALNSPFQLVTDAGGGAHVGDVRLALDSTGVLNVAWTHATTLGDSTTGPGPFDYRLQRFSLPSSPTSSAFVPLTAPVLILPTETDPRAGNAVLLRAGTGLLALWSDNRWGASELYAAPIDLGSCP
jgi:hypothetical protein